MINPTSSLGLIAQVPSINSGSERLDSSIKDSRAEERENLEQAPAEDVSDEQNRRSSIAGAASAESERSNRGKSEFSGKEESFKRSLRTAISEKRKSNETDDVKQAMNAAQNAPIVANQDVVQAPPSAPQGGEVRALETASPRVPILFEGAATVENAEEVLDTPGEVSAVVRFMQAMETEFGVDPKKLISAMASVQAQMVQLAPQGMPIQVMNQQTQTQFFRELGLSGPGLRRAEFLYQTMLKEMAQDSMANLVKESGQKVDVSLLSPAQIKRQEVGRSVDQMQKSFFMGERPSFGKPAIENPQPQVTNQQPARDATKNSSTLAGASSGAFFIPNSMTAASGTMALSNPETFGGGQQGPSGQVPAAVGQNSSSLNGFNPFGLGPIASGAESSSPDTSGSQDSFLEGGANSSSGAPAEGSRVESDARAVQSDFSKQFSLARVEGPMGMTTASSTERPEDVMNVRSLIQNAQVLLRQGGGEMKVQMNPEGLGQVDLKVKVNDGKVDVQMVAETADTKRLLEKNLGDLKASLAGQKLDVADVKVDMAKTQDRDAGQSQNSDFNREQARQFLGQFRDEREAMRNGMFELPVNRAYKGSKASQIQPTEQTQQPAAKNSSRLNVVV